MLRWFLILTLIFSSFSALAQVDSFKIVCFRDTVFFRIDSANLQIDTSKVLEFIVVKGKVVKGIASFYSSNLDGTQTATGEIYRNNKFTGASNNLKLNTWVRVTNIKNGKTVIVRINDRMHPAMKKKGRVIDLSRTAAKKLDFIKSGLTKVILEVIEPPQRN